MGFEHEWKIFEAHIMKNGDTQVSVSSEGSYHLKLAIQLATDYYVSKMSIPIVSWGQIASGLCFSSKENLEGFHPFPYSECTHDDLVLIIQRWLADQEYPPQPENDRVSKGWRLNNNTYNLPPSASRDHIVFIVWPEWREYAA